MKISTKLYLFVVTSLVLLGVIISAIYITNTTASSKKTMAEYRKDAYAYRKAELKSTIQVVEGIIQSIYKEKNKVLTIDEVKAEIINALRPIRLFEDKSGYIFIWDKDGTCIMNPPKPSIEGKVGLGKNVKDKNNVYVITELVKEAQKGGGFVNYIWPNPATKQDAPKVSYAQYFQAFGWMFGIGVYTDDIESKIAQMKTFNDEELSNTALLSTGLV